jgi:hypothetical protein
MYETILIICQPVPSSVAGRYIRRSFSRAGVRLDVIWATEDLDGRIALDAIVFAQITLGCAVNLDERDVLLLQCGGGFLILGSQGLAVTAPGCEELC